MELIPEEHPMMQYVLRFLLVYSLSVPKERSQKAQEFASALAERERTLLEKLVATRISIDEFLDGASDATRSELIAARDDIAALAD